MKRFAILATSYLVFNLAGKSQAPTVTTIGVSNITTNTVSCGGDVTSIGSSAVTDKGIVYGSTANPKVETDTKVPSGNGLGSFSCSLAGLTPGTTYHFRAYATNTSSTSYGSDLTFTTAESALTELAAKTKEIEDVKSKIDAFIANQKGSIFKVGLSVSLRTSFNFGSEKAARAIATISPNDKFVQIDYNDRAAVVISSTIAAYPFKNQKDKDGKPIEKKDLTKLGKFFINFGFLANINLVEFADNKSSTIFNKQVDGGLGFSYLLGTKQQFALALTYERISVRQPTKFIFEHEGKQVIGDSGTALTTLDIKDARFFRDAGFNAVSIKFVFHFN